jgi:hypothetical protein
LSASIPASICTCRHHLLRHGAGTEDEDDAGVLGDLGGGQIARDPVDRHGYLAICSFRT